LAVGDDPAELIRETPEIEKKIMNGLERLLNEVEA
jgi:hypothetical protein